jgi:hypothetical protein
MRGIKRLARGATQLGFVDVLTAVILLGILLYASTLQFSVYNRAPLAPTPTSAAKVQWKADWAAGSH